MRKRYKDLSLHKCCLVFMLLLMFSTPLLSQEDPQTKEELNITYKIRYEESERYFDSFREDDNIYFGEGTAKIENDIGEAIEKAKTKARNNLARNIKVKVKSTVNRVVSNSSSDSQLGYTEQTDESLEIQTETYTDQLLPEVKRSDYKRDYPMRNHVTIIFYIKKSLYNSVVEKDLEDKKSLIRNSIQNGTKKYNAKHYVEAVKDWLFAYDRLNDFFPGLPLQDDIESSGMPYEVNSYINDKITFFFSGLDLKETSGELLYDVQGQINEVPSIYAEYEDDYGNRNAVENLPLKIDFVEGNGRVRNKILTGIYGDAKLNVKDVNSEHRNVILRISIDENSFRGLNNFPNLSLPYLDISMKKMKTVALAVSFNNAGSYSSPDQLRNQIQSELLSRGLQLVKTTIISKTVTDSDLEIAKQTNADYLLYVYVNSNQGQTAGGYENMYIATSSGTLYIYQLPQGNLVSSKELSPVKGYGVSASGAGWNGFSKIKDQVFPGIKNMAAELK